jgi:hypothetical protein
MLPKVKVKEETKIKIKALTRNQYPRAFHFPAQPTATPLASLNEPWQITDFKGFVIRRSRTQRGTSEHHDGRERNGVFFSQKDHDDHDRSVAVTDAPFLRQNSCERTFPSSQSEGWTPQPPLLCEPLRGGEYSSQTKTLILKLSHGSSFEYTQIQADAKV